jgi:hypothetical protein
MFAPGLALRNSRGLARVGPPSFEANFGLGTLAAKQAKEREAVQ